LRSWGSELMATKKEGFFGTENLHRAAWTAIVGLAGFLGALLYYKFYGPQKVHVETISTSLPATQVVVETSLRNKQIDELTDAIRKLTSASSTGASEVRLRELSGEVDRLRAEVALSRKQAEALQHSGGITSTRRDVSSNLPTANASVKFSLPESNKGYQNAKLFGISGASCPPKVMGPSAEISVNFDLVDQSLMSRATPARVSLLQVRTDTDLLLLEETWVDMRLGPNSVTLSRELKAGNYLVKYGFYLRNNLQVEFPLFYSKECAFTVRSA
jgi:hypothetical protein